MTHPRFHGHSWLRDHTYALTTTDPAAPLDDLEPLREAIGPARVVSLGENSHFIPEFSVIRQRVLRFLVERCGFTTYALEFGFSEGVAVDSWSGGSGQEDDLHRLSDVAIPWGVGDSLRWVRRHNRTADGRVRFAGVDIPEAGGSLLPVLTPLADYLSDIDPEALPILERAREIAARFASTSMALSAPRWLELSAGEQDALSAALSRLLVRLRSVEPLLAQRGGQYGFDLAVRRLEGALHADYHFRAMASLRAGSGLSADTSAREVYMAGSVRWHLDHGAPGTRIVLGAHNAHIQRAPVSFDGHLTALPMGQHLSRSLGDDYFAIGLTSTGGQTAEMRLNDAAPFGFSVVPTDLAAPEPGSVEAAFVDADTGLAFTDLRRASRPDGGGPDRFRMHSAYMAVPVFDAFDGVINVGRSTVADDIGY